LKSRNAQGELKECYTLEVRWPFTIKVVSSPKQLICGSYWTVTIYPFGYFQDSEYISIHLTSHSEREIYASYKFTLVNQLNEQQSVTWSDPDEIVVFSPADIQDNEWGNDEFVDQSLFCDNSPFINEGNEVVFEIEVEVFGREDLISGSLVKAIEKMGSGTSFSSIGGGEYDGLIKLANEDLDVIKKRLPNGINVDEQKRQEDKIVTARLRGRK